MGIVLGAQPLSGRRNTRSSKLLSEGWVRGCSAYGVMGMCMAVSSPTSMDWDGRESRNSLQHQPRARSPQPCWGDVGCKNRQEMVLLVPLQPFFPVGVCSACPLHANSTPTACPLHAHQRALVHGKAACRAGCGLQPAALKEMKGFFGRFPHSSPFQTQFGSHLLPRPTWGTSLGRELGRAPCLGNGRGGAVLSHTVMLGWNRLSIFMTKSTLAPGHLAHSSPRSSSHSGGLSSGPQSWDGEPVLKELRAKRSKKKKDKITKAESALNHMRPNLPPAHLSLITEQGNLPKSSWRN